MTLFFDSINHCIFSIFKAIKVTDVDDVRDVLCNYKHHEDPVAAFRENHRKYQVRIHNRNES